MTIYDTTNFSNYDSITECVSTYESLRVFYLKMINKDQIRGYRLNNWSCVNNSCLLELKIGENFVFDTKESDYFCKDILAYNTTLRCLPIRESVVILIDEFLAALEINKTLTTLKLKHLFIDQYSRRVFKISIKNTIRILEKIRDSCITNFKITTFYSERTMLYHNYFYYESVVSLKIF